MLRRLALAAALVPVLAAGLMAHAGLRFSTPLEGATLGDTPLIVQLTFGERPDPALSAIHVIDTSSHRHDLGPPMAVAGDPLSLGVRVRPLGTGVYTVHYRIVSAVDGHGTSGSYAFGVRASPAAAAKPLAAAAVSNREILARWIFLLGTITFLGAACAEIGRFAGARNHALAAFGWMLATGGLLLLASEQVRTAGVPAGTLLRASVGRALLWRGGGLIAALVALAAARTIATGPRQVRAFALAAAGMLFTLAVHAAAGHAGSGRDHYVLTVATQWAHFAAAGVWLGGLGALLLALPGMPAETRGAAVHRFSTVAAVALVAVLVTGLWRAFNELTAWTDLTASAYGRAVLLKGGLFAVLAGLGAVNRWRGLPAVAARPRLLRLVGTTELAAGAVVLTAAAALGALPPPAASEIVAGIQASGVDFATTIRASLSALSNQPGPNRFIARVVDYDSREPVDARHVTLRFTPLDDPGVPPSSLRLGRDSAGTYTGSGANLSFDGRWRIAVAVERTNGSVEVPFDVEVLGRADPVIVSRVAGQPVTYTVVVRGAATLQFSPEPERTGPVRLYVTCYDFIWDQRSVSQMVVTHASGSAAARQLALTRVGPGRFFAAVDLSTGHHTFTAVARSTDGTRARASVTMQIPPR
jgi:copper transport protein